MDLTLFSLDLLGRDADSVLYRGRAKDHASVRPTSILVALPAAELPSPKRVRMLENELSLRDILDVACVVRPLALTQWENRAALVLEDRPGELLRGLLPSAGFDARLFLQLAINIAAAVCAVHRRGLVHKNIQPAHLLVDISTQQVWLTGFGIASRLLRERQAPDAPDSIAGTLAYMAPEPTGRMNRSIDTRSDLYAVGVTLYEMLTGCLPFAASEPMEWVHCHIARQPIAPHERMPHIAEPLSAIVMKLLAKTAEARYQTAAGLERDLRRCLTRLEAEGGIDHFPLGEHDLPDHLLVPEKLYGREQEIAALLGAFARVVRDGAPELVLISGYSGIGKSSVVHELHKVLVPPRGLFAAGKFDQYKRDIPYATLVQAFQDLVQTLLGKSEQELVAWRDELREALGPNGQLMVDLVPQLKLIIGDQAPVAELSPVDTQRRFQRVVQRFLAVFARPEHPLALFLDDLQWLDAATLQLLETLLCRAEVRHLLVIGAYRDNEVTSNHPWMRTLDAIKRANTRVHEIVLAPLQRVDLSVLITDTLHCGREHAAALAELVHDKTAGNPFFVNQFLSVLVEQGLLTFDHEAARWSWDLARIHAQGYTDNVVELMIDKLRRLPAMPRNALQQLACLGSSASLELLAASELPAEQLQQALSSGLVLAEDDRFRFVHDRVQEAAYSLMPNTERVQSHLRIGRLLVSGTPPDRREEWVFEILHQLNRAAGLLESPDEREQLAELNLLAGKRAKDSTAYASALHYLVAGATHLSDGWNRRHELAFALELQRAHCEFLTGELTAADERSTLLATKARTLVERAAVACLQVDLYATLNRSDKAIEVCLDYLRHLGVEWSARPNHQDARREYERTLSLLRGREIETLIDMPLISDPEVLATLNVLIKALTPAMFTDPNLSALVLCRMVNISLEHGNADESCYAYTHLSVVSGPQFGDYTLGFRFGQLGYELIERRGLRRLAGRSLWPFALFVETWTKPLRSVTPALRDGFTIQRNAGDLTYAAFALHNLLPNMFAAGYPLADAQREAELALEFVRQIRFDLVVVNIATQLALVRTLRGYTPRFGVFDHAEYDESAIEALVSRDPGWELAACWYWIRKLQARFFAGEHAAAVEAAARAKPLLWTSGAFLEMLEFQFYDALCHAALCDVAQGNAREQHVQTMIGHLQAIADRAEHCPRNFRDRERLIRAELARVEGRELEAQRLYDAAIKSARENDFVQNEALANELAASFYAARGFETIALAYLRNARNGYVRWGADGKVRQLERLHAQLSSEDSEPRAAGMLNAALEQLDLATVLQVSEAVSGEMVLEKLLDTLMCIAIEHAGAQRALLLLPRAGQQRIVAEATTRGATVAVDLLDEPMHNQQLAKSIVHYVLNTRDSVLLDDATQTNAFSSDPYVAHGRARSILCLPLSNQARLIGALYLEHSTATRVFVPARIAVLKLLASQAAISLENARLYRELAGREARIRRLVDANIIGICIWALDGRVLEANAAFLTLLGFEREELAAGRLRWTTLIPPEWRERAERSWLAELRANGTLQPLEAECFRRDGERVPVLIGVATFEEAAQQNQEGVAFVLDLSERKRTQEALNRAQAELAHVSRITTMSVLSASIAHEVSQPITGIVNNANTSLRILSAPAPDLEKAREIVARTLRDGNRAMDVITRLRALFSKGELSAQLVDLNLAARDVLALSANDLRRYRVVLQLQLAAETPLVSGDRVQLQQVILNLVRNAAEAMADVHDRPRELSIETQVDGERVRLTIRDVGAGIAPQAIDSLFDAFYTTKSSGMGIGLFVSRAIAEQHRGQLWAESNSDGPGARFILALPVPG